ncbi:unnamed protein product [marine sediment metagenome]|uniref:Uncharacterized protein n=1 Tax=marine sediment metagenome TaxID=412755 RepID=X1HNY4_9ZZZZ
MNLEVMMMCRNPLERTGEGGLISQQASSVVPSTRDIRKIDSTGVALFKDGGKNGRY